jgi:endothelin-converting enzyme
MTDVNNGLMRAILESPYATLPAPKSRYATGNATALDMANFEKMIKGYDSCMNTAAIDEVGAKPLQDILEAYDTFSTGRGNTPEDLTDKLIWVQRYGGSGLVQAQTWPDDKTPNITTIALGPGKLGLDAKEYYNNSKAIANYTTAIVGMFDNLYGDGSHALHVKLALGVVALEKRLAAATPDAVDTGDVAYYYNPLHIQEADALLPEVCFSRLIKAFAPKNYTIDTVLVLSPAYFQQISSIIQETPTWVLDAHLKWVLIQKWADRVSSEVHAPFRRLRNELAGKEPDAVGERWRTCLGDVDSHLAWILSAFYVRSAFSPEAKTFGERIITDIENVFMEKLKNYTWMSDSVKTKATQKVLNIVEKIGYPDISPNIEDPKALADFYATLEITHESWFANGLAYNKFGLDMLWNDLLRPTDKNRWFMTAPTVNAYFNPPTNEITFPAGIMQQPLFNLDLPEYVSYGAFGAVAGHELTHAFDDGGSHYDETGAYRDWWDNATLANFHNKTQCFVEQYSQYNILTPAGEKLNVNGKLTLGENIAYARREHCLRSARTLQTQAV